MAEGHLIPGQLTADKRQDILDETDIAIKNANILKISGPTPEAFIAKADRDPKSLSEWESLLIQIKFHIRMLREDAEFGRVHLSQAENDRKLCGETVNAVYDPKWMEIPRAVYIIAREKKAVLRVYPASFKIASPESLGA